MSRKDYILIAEAIKRARYYDGNLAYAKGIDKAVFILADVFASENPRFDSIKFFQAADYGKLPRESEVA